MCVPIRSHNLRVDADLEFELGVNSKPLGYEPEICSIPLLSSSVRQEL